MFLEITLELQPWTLRKLNYDLSIDKGYIISVEEVEKFLEMNTVNDTYLENLKSRMGIVEKKAPRVKKPVKKARCRVRMLSTAAYPDGRSLAFLRVDLATEPPTRKQ